VRIATVLAAAAVNLPPVSKYDTSNVPDKLDINGVTFTPDESYADD
jgi:phosphomethylpyrimidine synthase